MDSLFASANYRSFFRHRVKESGYNRGRCAGGRGLQKIQCIAECGWVGHFQISPCITIQRPNHLERALFVTRTLHSAWGREGGAACVSAISVPPVPCPDRNESHGNTTDVRSGARAAVRPVVRSSRPFCVQLGASLEIMLREHPSQPRSTLNGQDADRKIRKANSRNSLASKVQVTAAGTI